MIGRREPPSEHEIDKPLGFDDYDVRLGDLMRGERATLGKSLLDVQRELKIRASYIAAIENCDVAAFETPGFIAGYVRSYARYLGMDPEWAYARFCSEAGFTVAHGMSSAARVQRSAPPQKPRYPVDPLVNPRAPFVPKGQPLLSRIEPGAIGSLAVLAALIIGIGYGGVSVLREVQRVQIAPVDQAPGVVAELDPLERATGSAPVTAEPGGLAGISAPTADSLDRLYRPQALDTPVMVARDGPISAIDPGSVGTVTGATAALPEAARETALPDSETPVRVVADGPPKVEILAVRPAWVRVQSADGTVLFEKILDAGERYAVPQTEAPARLRAGNSGSVYFLVDGQTFGPARSGSNVVSNVDLSAESLSQTFAVADLSRDPELARMVNVARAD